MTTKRQNASKPDLSNSVENGGVYEIKIKGLLDDHWKQWFGGMELDRVTNEETGLECTLLTGPIPDQPALHGLLAKIRDLNLTLLSFRQIRLQDLRDQSDDQNDEQIGSNKEKTGE